MRSARMAEGSWLLAIMRSSVFRSRTASPYRYVSSPFPVYPPTNHLPSLEDQMASPIRVIPNILFLFRNQISRPGQPNFYDSLSFYLRRRKKSRTHTLSEFRLLKPNIIFRVSISTLPGMNIYNDIRSRNISVIPRDSLTLPT